MAELRRVLPLRTAVSTSAGLASAAVNFLACVEVATYAGGRSGWLAIVVAGLLIILSAANFSELSGLYPSAAAIRVWIRRGWSDEASMIGSLVYMATVVFVIAADAFVLAHMFQALVPAIPGLIWIVVLLGAVAWANLRGVKVAGWIQDVNALVLLGSLVAIAGLALTHAAPAAWTGMFYLGGGWPEAVALGVFIFVGFEWVTPLAEEFRDARVIPTGMYLALGVVAVAFGLFTLALQVAVPPAALRHTFVPQLLLGMKALGPLGYWWMGLVTLTTVMTTFNGGLVSASRFLYAAARERMVPQALARLNAFWVPQAALLLLFVVSLGLALVVWASGQYLLLINTGAAVESFMYALVAWLVLSLRRREPERRRTYRVIGEPVWGWVTMAVFAALGVGSATTATGLPGAVPWPFVFLAILTGLAVVYVRRVVPRLKAAREGRGATSASS